MQVDRKARRAMIEGGKRHLGRDDSSKASREHFDKGGVVFVMLACQATLLHELAKAGFGGPGSRLYNEALLVFAFLSDA